jgi:hypothetical protein
VFEHYEDREGFLEVTQRGFQDFSIALALNGSARGRRFQCRRSKGGAKGRLIFELLRDTPQSFDLPPAKPVLPALAELWESGR